MDETVITWVTSYLKSRSQFVSVGTAESSMCKVDRGVPQGSVLGPLLYSIFTNEMSEVVTDINCPNICHNDGKKLFHQECDHCGKLSQYADDATYHTASKHRVRNQQNLTQKLKTLGEYLNSNQLTINKDKTKILEVMLKQKRGRLPVNPPELQVINSDQEIETIKTSKHCRILGLNVQENLAWTAHLETGSKPLLPSLRKNLGALRNLGKLIPQQSRNTIARGLIISRLTYLISIWGGATPNLIRRAQTIQNAAARWVSGRKRSTKISTLLEATNWFSIREMTRLNSANIIWKTLNKKTPANLHEQLIWDRQSLDIEISEPRLQFSRRNFSHRESLNWNEIPCHIRKLSNIGNFKKHMKIWVKSLRPRMPD